jgi:hypothetical protein
MTLHFDTSRFRVNQSLLLLLNAVLLSGKAANPNSLQYTVFFYNCKLFGLRAFDEHRSRECEQFEIGSDNHRKYVHFIGRSNKTFKGGIKQMKLCTECIPNT